MMRHAATVAPASRSNKTRPWFPRSELACRTAEKLLAEVFLQHGLLHRGRVAVTRLRRRGGGGLDPPFEPSSWAIGLSGKDMVKFSCLIQGGDIRASAPGWIVGVVAACQLQTAHGLLESAHHLASRNPGADIVSPAHTHTHTSLAYKSTRSPTHDAVVAPAVLA